MNKRMFAAKARRVVVAHARSLGIRGQFLKNTPLHYLMSDLVSGLMLLAEKEKLDFSIVLKDARENVQEVNCG